MRIEELKKMTPQQKAMLIFKERLEREGWQLESDFFVIPIRKEDNDVENV